MYLVLYIIYMGFILCVHLFISLHKYLFECCFHICKGKKYGWEKNNVILYLFLYVLQNTLISLNKTCVTHCS